MMRTLQRAEEMRRRFQTPPPLVGAEGAHRASRGSEASAVGVRRSIASPRASDGKVRGNSPRRNDRHLAASPLTLPMLRMGPLPLPQGEREFRCGRRP